MTARFVDHSAVCGSRHCETNMRLRLMAITVAPRFMLGAEI
jgi:hypothetical protein